MTGEAGHSERRPSGRVRLRDAVELETVTATVVRAVRTDVLELVPGADVLHTGASSLPGVLTAGDVDLHVRVAPESFGAARDALRARFGPHRPDIWCDGFATFVVDDAPLPAQIALTARGGEHDTRFTRAWARLRAEPALVAELNRLKRDAADDPARYEAAKGAFFSRLEREDR